MSLDPQSSWIQWVATTAVGVLTAIVGLFVSFGRDAAKIYRAKVDSIEARQSTFAEKYITREELRDEMTRRAEESSGLTLQMHNHNATLLKGIDTRIGELREDVKDVHRRIDDSKK